MKKILCLLLAVCLLTALNACGKKQDTQTEAAVEESTEAVTEPAQDTPAETEAETPAGEAEPVTEEAEVPAEEDGQNPVMNFVGPYASGRAHAMVEAEGSDRAKITIEWGDSANALVRWVMSGTLDPDTLTVEYYNCVRSYVTYKEDGSVESETAEYENGTGTIIFDGGSSFTWKGNQSEQENLVFAWAFETEDAGQSASTMTVYTADGTPVEVTEDSDGTWLTADQVRYYLGEDGVLRARGAEDLHLEKPAA